MWTSSEAVIQTLGVKADSQGTIFFDACGYGAAPVSMMINVTNDAPLFYLIKLGFQFRLEADAALTRYINTVASSLR